MSHTCDACGAWVSADYHRVHRGNDGKLHGCRSCTSPGIRTRAAAGLETDFQVRTDADGKSIPKDRAVATDGGQPVDDEEDER